MSTPKTPLSCNELGLCAGRKPRCAGCTEKDFPFAPGVIDAPGKPYHWRWTDALGAIVLVALASYLVRYWQ